MQNRSAPPYGVIPTLIYPDVAAAIAWLCTVFGFTERLRALGPDGQVTHAQISVGDGAVMLGAAGPDFRPPAEAGPSLCIRVKNVDEHFARTREAGAAIAKPPEDLPYGERQYTAVDIGGHRWTFTQTIADVDPAEWGAQFPGVELVTVAVVQGMFEEEQIRSFLEANGVPVHVRGEAVRKVYTGIADGLGSAEIQVPRDFEALARDLLATANQGKLTIEEE